MSQPATKPEEQICYHKEAPIGTVTALEAILNHAAKQQPLKPFQFPVDFHVTEVIRNGEPIKVQVEVDDYFPAIQDVWDISFGCTGAGPFETEETEAEVCFGNCYTADQAMTDVELTTEEWARVERDYLSSKERYYMKVS